MERLHEKFCDDIHWLTMRLTLPQEGVAIHFRSEPARLRRLTDVRWPNGPQCVRCDAEQPTWIRTREIFQCSQCRHQFSVTSGTFTHRTRLNLGTWFGAVESLVHYRSAGVRNHMPAQALARKLGIEYVAARRIRTLVIKDVQVGGRGILSSALCIQPLILPEDTNLGSIKHLAWLLDQLPLKDEKDG